MGAGKEGTLMRRLVLTLAATASVLALAPAMALARHHHHSGALRHHARIMRFGDLSGQPSTTSPTSNAGTVVSFTGGVLTIQTGNSTVSGTVTNDTTIECATSGQDQSGEDQGDQSTSGTDQSTGDDDQGTSGTDQSTGDDDQGTSGTDQSTGDDDQSTSGTDQSTGEDDQSSSGSCSSSNLTPGTTIHAAELRISSAGNVWEKVELGS
jgi:hypothetical protein